MTDTDMFKDRDIIVLSSGEWNDNAVSNMQIPRALSSHNRVVYVETMGGRMPKLSELGRVWARIMRMFSGELPATGRRGLDKGNVSILSPFAIPYHKNGFINWINKQILLFQVRRLMERRGIKRPIVWSFSPRWQPVAEALDKACLVFHCVDGLHTYDASPRFKALYERAARGADIVFTPGIVLGKELKALNRNTHLIGHGCGVEHLDYQNREIPDDLADIPTPQAVYAGTLANWVDYDLIGDAAKRLPDVSFVLIGYVHALAPKEKVEEVFALPNVYPVGYKNFGDLPAYYRAAQVGIVPYAADNEHIYYSTPTKYLDYSAAGLQTVSTRFPAAEVLDGIVVCADNAEEFAQAIETAIQSTTKEDKDRYQEFARDNTWVRQVEKMCAKIRETVDC